MIFMNDLGIILFILSSLLIAILSVVFDYDNNSVLLIAGVMLFLVFSTLFPANDLESEKTGNKIHYKAELKDGTIKEADKCYKKKNKSVCEFHSFISPEVKVVEDYWIDE